MSEQPAQWESKDEIRGIRGWLLLPLFHLIANPLFLIWSVVQRLPELAARVPLHSGIVQSAYVVLTLPYFAFLIWCLVRFLQERREVPWLMTAFYVINFAFLSLTLVARAMGYAAGDEVIGGIKVGATLPSLVQAALCLVLIAYFHTSVRVKNTFFRR